MSKGKCADKAGIFMEMIMSGSYCLDMVLVRMFNSLLRYGQFPSEWQTLFFVMLPKPGQPMDVNNWRPIAILSVIYKVFAKLLCLRLQPILSAQQASEQMGFMPNRSVDDALVVVESMIGKSLESDFPLWIVSVDLRQAFDRIEYNALFDALSEQGVPIAYRNLLKRLYTGQAGTIDGLSHFDIMRGVRQGDVLSPMLFNAALESAMRRWKNRIGNCGFRIRAAGDGDSGCNCLDNVRYADDILLFARSLNEAVFMLEALTEVLSEAGLSLNGSKTKIMTTSDDVVTPMLVECGSSFVEVLGAGQVHKYLGRVFSGDLCNRGKCNLSHRISCGWQKFHEFSGTLLNRKIAVHLRFKLFDSIITPTVLYSLTSSPLTAGQLNTLDCSQRKILRRIVGWIQCEGDDWHAMGQTMKRRLSHALQRYPIDDWSITRNMQRDRLLHRLACGQAPTIVCRVHEWLPEGRRKRGRPLTRWTEN